MIVAKLNAALSVVIGLLGLVAIIIETVIDAICRYVRIALSGLSMGRYVVQNTTTKGRRLVQINGKLSGDFEVKRIRYYPETKIREAITVLKTKVKRADGARVWGEEFVKVAFASLFKVDDGHKWACEKITKPNLVCELHTLIVNSETLEVQPEIPELISVEDEEAVIVPLTIRIDLKTEKLAGKIAFTTGKTVELELQAKQAQLPGTNANSPAIRKKAGAHGNPEPARV